MAVASCHESVSIVTDVIVPFSAGHFYQFSEFVVTFRICCRQCFFPTHKTPVRHHSCTGVVPYDILHIPAVFGLADQLGHGAHGAVDTPAAGLEEHHGDQAQHGGGEHHAVKAEGKLGHAGVEQGSVVGPVPGQLEGPQQGDHLFEVPGPGKDQPGVPEHQEEHGKEEGQESVPENLALHPVGNVLFADRPNRPPSMPNSWPRPQ